MKNTLITLITIALMAGSIFAGTDSDSDKKQTINKKHSESMMVASDETDKELKLTKEEQKLHDSIVKKMISTDQCTVDHPDNGRDIYPEIEDDYSDFRR